MSKTKTESERIALLNSLGVGAKGKSLGKGIGKTEAPHRSKRAVEDNGIVLAPPGVDPHTMPVDEIVFDERLLEEFTDLKFTADGNDASRKVFKLYKSPTKNPERNGALQRRITSFITATRRSRMTGRPISEKIATTADQRDMAALLATTGYKAEDVVRALELLEKEEKD